MKIKSTPMSLEDEQIFIKAHRELLARAWLQEYAIDPASGEKVPYADLRKILPWFPEGKFLYEQGLLKGQGPLAEIERLLGPVVVLQSIGSPKELRRKTEQLVQAGGEILSVPHLNTGIVGSAGQHTSELIANVEKLASRAEEAEKTLKEAGWRFDYKTRKVKELPTPGLPNRPKELVNQCVECLYDFYRDDSGGNTERVRKQIHDYLKWFFPEEMITTERKGPIWRAINNHLHK